MSITRSVELLAKILILPVVPAGTMAAFATTVGIGAPFSEDTVGWLCPVAHAVRNPSGPEFLGTAAKLSEYACAAAGMPQDEERMGNARGAPPVSDGPPS